MSADSLSIDALGLLEAIRAAPGDDVPRLVFADWLEDDGQAERAEFIRLQIALARHEQGEPSHSLFPPGYLIFSKREKAKRRERELLLTNGLKWAPRLSPLSTFAVIVGPEGGSFGTPAVEFRRGFVERVCCPLAAWREHGPALVRAHPVTRIEIVGKEPDHEEDNLYHWYFYDPDDEQDSLPSWLHDGGLCAAEVLQDSREEALSWLSRRAIAWAKLPDAKRGQP